MSDDPLGDLLKPARGRTGTPSSGKPGINPLDLLSMSEDRLEIVSWLSRHQQATLQEICAALNQSEVVVQARLHALLEEGAVNQALIEGALYYRVVFKRKTTREHQGLPRTVWERLDLDNTAFLSRFPLLSQVPSDEIERLANRLKKRYYQRSEVIIWQGAITEAIYMIKSGIVGISRISPKTQDAEILSYLREGDMMGEYSLLADQNRTATATATALTEVEVLMMDRSTFYDLLHQHPSVSIELSRMLVRRILTMNARMSGFQNETNLCLVVETPSDNGTLKVGHALAIVLSDITHRPTVYVDLAESASIVQTLQMTPFEQTYHHKAGHDIYIMQDSSSLPASVTLTLLIDQLSTTYATIVLSIPDVVKDSADVLVDKADMILLVSPATAAAVKRLTDLSAALKPRIRPEKTLVFTLLSGTDPAQPLPSDSGDFMIPYAGAVPPLPDQTLDTLLPAALGVLRTLADRLGRTNQISLYIPSTVSIDQTIDPRPYVERTLTLLGRLFGGATSNRASGVWNSEQLGLVSEEVYVVRSYTTPSTLERALPEVLTFVERLKQELKQEAMAIEINEKFMLL